MQLISLNIWGGQVHDPLINFINKHKDTTDIFCFQEIFRSDRNLISHGSHTNIFRELNENLTDFNGYFSPTAKGHDTRGKVEFPLEFGQMTFVKNSLGINRQGEIFVHKKFNEIGEYYPDGRVNFPRNFIYTEIESSGGKKFIVLNLHGIWEPAPKTDIPERIKQSEIMIKFIKESNLPAIIAGDFNLRIDTKSLQMFEDAGMRNLVKESKATTTRSSHYENKWKKDDLYADYMIITKGIYVTNFKVMKDDVSDHLPMLIKFEL